MATTEPEPTLPTTSGDVWDSHLTRLFSQLSTITPTQLAQSVFTHATTHVDCILVTETQTRTSADLIYNVWEETTNWARKDSTIHEQLLEFIREFWKLVETMPWEVAGRKYYHLAWYISDSGRGGPCEPSAPCNPAKNYSVPHECDDDDSDPPDGTFAEKRASWINYCRFVALLDRERIIGTSKILESFMGGVLEDVTWKLNYPDSALLAFEQVIAVAGQQLWERGGQWDRDVAGVSGVELEGRWKGWEERLEAVKGDCSREVEVREAAGRLVVALRGIRERGASKSA